MKYIQTQWLQIIIVVVSCGLAFGCGAVSAAETLVIAGWSGDYEKQLRQVGLITAFEMECKCKVEWLAMSSYENYGRLKSQKDNPQTDIALFDDIVQQQAAREGLFATLDRSIVKHLDDIEPRARLAGDTGVGFGYNVVGVFYNRKVFEEKGIPVPTSWNDWFRPELKGRVVMRSITSAYGLYPLLMMNRLAGGDDNNMEPGLRRLRELVPNVLDFPGNSGKQNQLMLSGDGWLSATGTGDFIELRKKGAPLNFVIPKEGTIGILETVNVVKGAPHPKLAQMFVNALTTPSGQHRMAVALSWMPVSTKVPIDDEIRNNLPLDPAKPLKLVPIDFQAVMTNRGAWTEQFNKDIAK